MSFSRLEWLRTRRDALRSQIETAEASYRPDYSVGGRSFSHTAAIESLYKRLNAIEAEIFQLENGGEVITEGFSA